jgi:hypothetical protein
VERPTELSLCFEMNIPDLQHLYIRMLAKVALGLGYIEFGAAFRSHFKHHELRQILFASNIEEISQINSDVAVDIPFLVRAGNHEPLALLEELCANVDPASCIAITPGPDVVAFSVGVIGKYIGTIFCPCDVDAVWPRDEDFLGRFILLRDRRVVQMSMRHAYERLVCSQEIPEVWQSEAPIGFRDTLSKHYASAQHGLPEEGMK